MMPHLTFAQPGKIDLGLGVVLGIQQDPLQGKIDPLPLQIDPLPLPLPLKILVHHQVHQLQFKEAVKKVV